MSKRQNVMKLRRLDALQSGEWDSLSWRNKKERVLIEQNYACATCGIKTWNNMSIILELDHVDGNRQNNTRENLRRICPNCHSQTPTYKAKNIKFHPNWKI